MAPNAEVRKTRDAGANRSKKTAGGESAGRTPTKHFAD
jgi:hypothetical protein